MTRNLVPRNEAFRHPIRLAMPYGWDKMPEAEKAECDQAHAKAEPDQREPMSDLAFFLTSFVGFFVIIMGMTS
jgi:hypothetical protein